MKTKKYTTLSILLAGEVRAEKDLRFTIECKNTKIVFEYDLNKTKYGTKFQKIFSVAAWAIFRRRDAQGHIARAHTIALFKRFIDFLESIDLYNIEELNRSTLSHFAAWLKRDGDLSYATAGSMYRALTPHFIQMSKHPSVDESFIPIRNSFPKSTALSSQVGYDQDELKDIVSAAIKGIRASAARLEKKYEPTWLGRPAPLEDVATIGRHGRRSIWATQSYRIWWWENNCECKPVNSTVLFRKPGGQCFFNSLSTSGIGSIALLNRFYDKIGAWDAYKPSFLGKESPIKYRTPWKKHDYLIWYWENHLGCRPLSGPEAKARSPEFYGAIREYSGGRFREFFENLGITRRIETSDLIPYYIMLLIRTQLNPSTIQRLTIDCIIEDPIDKERASIKWTKFRSNKTSTTIPLDQARDGWPIKLIKRVIQATRFIRNDGMTDLWISNSNPQKISKKLGPSTFKKGLQIFSAKHQLKKTDGSLLSIQAKLIRPTMAWAEYLRTEDMMYLQTLLGHSKLTTTADYLRRIDDPVLRSRRALHQEAMFTGLSTKPAILASDAIVETANNLKIHETLLNHCKDPMDSPIFQQRAGVICSVKHETCLGCQNLIITHADIKKYFCFLAFHEHLQQSGDISIDEYNRAVSEKKHIWTEYILPKYDRAVVERIHTEALESPIPVWDIALYESERQ